MAKIKRSSLLSKYKPLKWVILLIFIVAVVFLVLQLAGVTHFFAKQAKTTATTGGAYTKGLSGKAKQNGSADSSTSTVPPGTNSTNKVPTSSNANLIAPWGTFANVYNAGPSEQMGSTCNTTPGATCQIIFTNGGQTKSLDAEQTDSGGAVYWSWTPSGIGLTPGTWHITAKAVLGSQTKTTSNDPLTLKVTE